MVHTDHRLPHVATRCSCCFCALARLLTCTFRRGLCLRCLPFLYTLPSARSRSARSRSLRCRSLQVWPHSQQVTGQRSHLITDEGR